MVGKALRPSHVVSGLHAGGNVPRTAVPTASDTMRVTMREVEGGVANPNWTHARGATDGVVPKRRLAPCSSLVSLLVRLRGHAHAVVTNCRTGAMDPGEVWGALSLRSAVSGQHAKSVCMTRR